MHSFAGGGVRTAGQTMAATTSAETSRARRLGMVNGQLRTGDVVDQDVLAAFLDTPRERFVCPSYAELAYLDRDAPALGAKSRRLLPPLTLARMLQAAAVMPGERVLDVGGGSGYGAAVLAAMGAKVAALELRYRARPRLHAKRFQAGRTWRS